MVVGVQTQNGRRYPFYRCPPVGDCTRRVTIGAVMVEDAILDATAERLAGREGQASAERGALQAAEEAERAQADLDAAIRAFAGVSGERAAVERIGELTQIRDAAARRAHELGGLRSVRRVRGGDVRSAPVEIQRDLIRATLRAHVGPGRGLGRLRFEFLV